MDISRDLETILELQKELLAIDSASQPIAWHRAFGRLQDHKFAFVQALLEMQITASQVDEWKWKDVMGDHDGL